MADNIGASFSRLPGGDPRARRGSANMAEEWGAVKAGLITAVNSDHLVVQPFNENDKIRVDLAITGSVLAVVPPYIVGDQIACVLLKTPRTVDYPWIDMNLNSRSPVRFYVKPIALNIPMITKAISARSCSISLPLSDTFTDTDGTLLAAHYPDAGCGWTSLVGNISNWTIQGNKLRCEDVAGNSIRAQQSTDDGTHDVQISATVGSTGSASDIVLETINRITSSTNHWRGDVRVNATATLSTVQLREINGGVNTQRALNTTTDITHGSNITLLFEDGNPGSNDLLLTISGDFSTSITYNSSLHAGATGVGIGYSQPATVTVKTLFDNFSCSN
jgi:hypothetical protein